MSEAREADLDAWMSRLALGDRSAFDPLYAALCSRARRFAAMRIRAGEAAADDVAQAALLKVFARASEFTPGKPCLPWFYAIVANEIRSAQRASTRLVLEDASESLVDASSDAEAQMIDREVSRALELAIESLDDDAANAIAAVLGRAPMPACAPATFRKRVSRAYAKLRLILGANDAV